MVFDQPFRFGDVVRCSFGWPTPNYAGAFLASLLPYCWGLFGGRWYRIAGEIVGSLLLAMLVATYSRGAVVASACAAVFWVLSRRDARRGDGGWGVWIWRGTFVTMLVLGTGFYSRIAAAAGASDAAVTHRLSLWRGALEMIATNPVHGVGLSKSGLMYMEYFQPLTENAGFDTMVNGYLTVATELGLIVFTLVIAAASVGIQTAWDQSREQKALSSAAGASLITWLVANIFSTLWMSAGLWSVQCLNIAVLVWHWSRRPRQSPFYNGVFSAVGITIAIYSLGFMLRLASPVEVEWDGEQATLSPRTARPTCRWYVCADTNVLGQYSGRILRQWCSAHHCSIVVQSHGTELYDAGSGINVLLAGNSVVKFAHITECFRLDRVVILNPTSPPDSGLRICGSRIRVALPKVDELGVNASWRAWAHSRNADLVESSPGIEITSGISTWLEGRFSETGSGK